MSSKRGSCSGPLLAWALLFWLEERLFSVVDDVKYWVQPCFKYYKEEKKNWFKSVLFLQQKKKEQQIVELYPHDNHLVL